jgi:hypothetical protein
MRNWVKRREGASRRSAAAQHAAQVRWERYHADARTETATEVCEVTIVSTVQTRRVIRLERTLGTWVRGCGGWLLKTVSAWDSVGIAGRKLSDLLARSLA